MIESDLIRHQIFLLRAGNGVYNGLIPELRIMRDKIIARVSKATPNELIKIKSLVRDLDSIIEGSFNTINPKLVTEMENIAIYEGQHALKMLDANTAAAVTIGAGVNDAALIAMVGKSKLFLDDKPGQTIDDLITTFSDRYKKDIKSEIELGLLSGDTTDDIVNRIQALSNGRTKEQAKALVLTLANHVGHVARDNVWGDYEDLFEGYEYVATLDQKTTILCGNRDGKVYPADKFPHLPAHYRCRSIKVPKVKEKYSLGIDTRRSSIDGQVSSKMTYSDWLKTQSKAQQDEILGKTRAELFRSGKVTLDKFVDDKGKMYSLAQLKKADVIGTVKINVNSISSNKDFNALFGNVKNESAIEIMNKMPSINGTKFKLVTEHSSSFYDGWERTLHISKREFNTKTAIHEYGHFIDYSIGTEGKNKTLFPSASLFESIIKDVEEIGITSKTKIGKEKIMSILSDITTNVSKESADILDAMTDGYILDKGLGHGHGSKYYKGMIQKPSEIFANMFQIYAMDENFAVLEKNFPNTASKFLSILDEIKESLK